MPPPERHQRCARSGFRTAAVHDRSEGVIPLKICPIATSLKALIPGHLDTGFDLGGLTHSIEARDQAGAPGGNRLRRWNPLSMNFAARVTRLAGDPGTVLRLSRAGKQVTMWEETLLVEGLELTLR